MVMTDQEQKDLRSYCALLLKEYGFHFSPNDPVIPALYIIYKEMQANTQRSNALTILIKDASSKINPTVFHFHVPGEALRFQIGQALKWMLLATPVLLMSWIGVWHWSMTKDLDQARNIINTFENVSELVKHVKKNDDGYYFIDFTISKGDSIQQVREFGMLNPKTVRVYLGKGQK
jgi:hypothetical protein